MFMPCCLKTNKEKSLFFLNISVFFQTQMFLLPVLFLFYQHCGLSLGDFFLFQGIYALAALFFEIPAGYLGDIFPKKNILILSYSFFIVRLILWLFFSQYGYWILLIGEILYAAQKASFSGVSDSYIYEYLQFYNIPQAMLKRYSRMNFAMSVGAALSSLFGAWLYHLISEWSLLKYQHDYGFLVLIVIELILNITALYLLILLPKIPQKEISKLKLGALYQKFFHIIGWTMKNPAINYHILYSGLLSATTLIFVWSFQPIMELLLIPISIYGVVYFINHFIRALVGAYLDKLRHFISFSKIVLLSFISFVISFILTLIVINFQPLSIYFNLFYFTFVSLSIGVQLAYFLSHVSRFHDLIPQNIRAMVSSVNMLFVRLYSFFFFILIKILLDGMPLYKTFVICFVIFIVASFPLKYIYSISLKEEKEIHK